MKSTFAYRIKYIVKAVCSYVKYGTRIFLKLKSSTQHYYGEPILDIEDGSNLIIEALSSDLPVAIGRFGTVEHRFLREYSEINIGIRKEFSTKTTFMMKNNAGFFSNTNDQLMKYGKLMSERYHETDILACFDMLLEDFSYKNYCYDSKLTVLKTVDPLQGSWSKELEGKKVLVVSPFATSIKYQYENKRINLFEKSNRLPEFKALYVVKAVQTIAGNIDDRFATWFDALDYMEAEVMKYDFDIALISAGAYGFPLALSIKNQGKKAIHIGGSLQLLFGIKGKRWEDNEFYHTFFNKHWINPSFEEIPENMRDVEEGCYW